MAKDIVSGGDAGGNGDCPAVVVGNQLVRCPYARYRGVVDKTNTVNLHELEFGLINVLAWPIAVGQIIDDRTVVARRPRGPLQTDLASCNDWGLSLSRSCSQMTDNIGIRIVLWANEAIAQVLWNTPTDHNWRRTLELEAWAVSFEARCPVSDY